LCKEGGAAGRRAAAERVFGVPKTSPEQGLLAERGATAWLGAAVGGPVGFAVSIGVSIAWDIWAAPWIYEQVGAIPTRNLEGFGP